MTTQQNETPVQTDEPTCRFCGGPNTADRVEIGYTHCRKPECQVAWKAERFSSWTTVLLPKQGFTALPQGHPLIASTGRSSGRS